MLNVVIAGRPNVGKSALFNRLAGKRIAIVHDQPGITRDRISAECDAEGRKFTLWDTGGIIGTGEKELPAEVRASAEAAIKESDLVLLVVDAKQGLSPMDRELATRLRRAHKPVVLVVNKIDDAKHEPSAVEFSELGFDDVFAVSAAHGRGVRALQRRIGELLENGDENRSPAASPSTPLKIAIVGRPNAGKSSLINSLLCDKRTIVSETPGTTRDAIDIEYRRAGKPYLLIDTAGIRARSKHSSSVEVFSVMRAEKTIRRADLCMLVIDIAEGIKAQDRRVAALIQQARKACVIVLNKWDLIRPVGKQSTAIREVIAQARAELFFIDYAPVLVTSATTGEHADRLFDIISQIARASRAHIGTGRLNRLLRAAFAANPPAMIRGRRLKLFYATLTPPEATRPLAPPEIMLFVNSPRLLTQPYARFLEAQIRAVEPYPGLPILLTLRSRRA